jgi:hypothetical protein
MCDPRALRFFGRLSGRRPPRPMALHPETIGLRSNRSPGGPRSTVLCRASQSLPGYPVRSHSWTHWPQRSNGNEYAHQDAILPTGCCGHYGRRPLHRLGWIDACARRAFDEYHEKLQRSEDRRVCAMEHELRSHRIPSDLSGRSAKKWCRLCPNQHRHRGNCSRRECWALFRSTDARYQRYLPSAIGIYRRRRSSIHSKIHCDQSDD